MECDSIENRFIEHLTLICSEFSFKYRFYHRQTNKLFYEI